MRILTSDVEHLTASDENTDLAGCHDRERPLVDGRCAVQRVDKDFFLVLIRLSLSALNMFMEDCHKPKA